MFRLGVEYGVPKYDQRQMNMSKNRRIKANDNAKLTPNEPEDHKKCRYCQESIHTHAKVCYHCARHQSWFWQHLGNFELLISTIGLAASIIMVAVSQSQLAEARKERITATEAKNAALCAQRKTETAHQDIKETVKAFAAIVYFQGVVRNEIGTDRAQEAWRQIEHELARPLNRILPDPNERTAFVHDLDGRLPKKAN